MRFAEDLVESGLKIHSQAYALNHYLVKFDKEDEVGFEVGSTRPYIKTLRTRALFEPHDQAFELTSKGNRLEGKPHKGNDFSDCPGSTLMVPESSSSDAKDAYVFCFFHFNDSYALMYDLQKSESSIFGHKNYRVESIFRESPETWLVNERLLLIFNYLNDTVVFVSDKHQHVLKYRNFAIRRLELVYSWGSEAPIKKPNCLVDEHCTPPSPPTKIVPTPSTPNPSISDNPDSSAPPSNDQDSHRSPGVLGEILRQIKKTFEKAKGWQLLLFILLLATIILGVCFLTRKRDLKHDSPIVAKFYRSSSNSTLQRFKGEKRSPGSASSKQRSEDRSGLSQLMRSSKLKRFPTPSSKQSKQSTLTRNRFSNLFTDSSQASAIKKPGRKSKKPAQYSMSDKSAHSKT